VASEVRVFPLLALDGRRTLRVAAYIQALSDTSAKHGIDFVEAQALWLDEMLIEIPARTEDEPRFLVVGLMFDADKDITADLDLSGARRPLRESRRVNVDFPSWMVESLDREAKRLGVTRQPVIKIWIAERLERKVS